MFYSLFDKNFNSIGSYRSTYPCDTWNYTQRAFEFDELKIEGMKLRNMENAMFVQLQEDRGTVIATALSGIPQFKNNKTIINAIDPRRILDTEAIIDFTNSSHYYGSLGIIYKYLLSLVFDDYTVSSYATETSNSSLVKIYHYTGGNPYEKVILDVSEITANNVNLNSSVVVSEKKVGNVWKTIQSINAVHNTCIVADIDIPNKTITFKVKVIREEISFKIEDFDTPRIIRDTLYVNRIIATNGTTQTAYYLLNDDSVVGAGINSIVIGMPHKTKLQYPIQTKIIQKDDLREAISEALKELYKNRYRMNVEIDASATKMGYLFDNIDFGYIAKIYGFNSDDYTQFKSLPLMEIITDSKGTKKVKFGRLNEYWWQ